MNKAPAVLIAAPTLGLSCATTALAAEEATFVPSTAFVGQNVPAKSDAKLVKPFLQKAQVTKKKSQDKKKDKVPFR